MDTMTIGERIKYYRELAGMTQQELATRAGVSYQAISKYENGIVTNIPTKRLQLIADALETNGAVLMGYQDYAPEMSKDEESEWLETLRNDPDIRMLLSSGKKLNKDDIRQLIALAERMNRE